MHSFMNSPALELIRQQLRKAPPELVRKTMLKLCRDAKEELRCIFETTSGSRYFVANDGSSLRISRNIHSGIFEVSPTVASAIVFIHEELAETLLQSQAETYKTIEAGVLTGRCVEGAIPLEAGIFNQDIAIEHDGVVRIPDCNFFHIGHPVSYIHSSKAPPRRMKMWFKR